MSNLFRKEVTSTFSSNAYMFKTAKGFKIRTIFFLLMLVLCTGLFLLWLFCGTVYETVTVNGIVWPDEIDGYVYSDTEGLISKTVVSNGAYVSAGDIIAVVPQEELLKKISTAKKNGVSDEELSALYKEYNDKSMIRSNIDGLVTHIADDNSYITQGTLLAKVVHYDKNGNNRTVTAFVPSEESGRIKIGMEAQVTPDFVSRDEAGFVHGYISDIYKYPVKGQLIAEENPTLFLSELNTEENYIQIKISLFPDSSMESNLKWSSKKSGDIEIPLSTTCSSDIVIKSCRPYEWLF